MYNAITIVAAVILILANLFLFSMVTYFAKGKKDKASVIGFGFIKLLTLLDALFITGGILALC